MRQTYLDVSVQPTAKGARAVISPGQSFAYGSGVELLSTELDALIADLIEARDKIAATNKPRWKLGDPI